MIEDLEIRRYSADKVRPLRQVILRPGQPIAAVTYPGDEVSNTLHLGALLKGDLVGVASVFEESPPGKNYSKAWRLRGMGVLGTFQGLGIGKLLLMHSIAYIAGHGGASIWCNARTPVIGFYRSMGFSSRGDEFNIPGAGPHYFMERPVYPEEVYLASL